MIFEHYHLMLPFDLLMIFYKIIYNFIFRNLIKTLKIFNQFTIIYNYYKLTINERNLINKIITF